MGQFEPTTTVDDQIAGGQSAAPPTNARHNFTSDGLSSDGVTALLPGVGEALDGIAELAALALGVPSTFICLEIGDHCRVVASHGLSEADISLAEILSADCLRSSARLARQANAT